MRITSPTSMLAALLVLSATLAVSRPTTPQTMQPVQSPGPQRIVMTEALVINRVGGTPGRVPLSIDAVQSLLIQGQWKTPKAGDMVALPNGVARRWSEAKAGEDGTLNDPAMRGGYALWIVESDRDKIMLLKARGHGMAYVNGEPRMGDPYSNGIVTLPVKLKKGANEILFHCSRGAIAAELIEPPSSIMVSQADVTLPDLQRSMREESWGAAVLINASEEVADGLGINASFDDLGARTALDPIPPMSVRKVGFRLPRLRDDPASDAGAASKVATVQILRSITGEVDWPSSLEVTLAIADSLALQRRTFISEIDGSVQYYAVRPALKPDPSNGLIFTLHGASVEASGQAAAYQSKDWAHIVAPTNRRPFGFDWEDWGRLDGMEVLGIAKREFQHDPNRVHLTGHSMGGHGTWQLGVTYPDQFAAIAPSAGWISFESYNNLRPTTRPGEQPHPLDLLMKRASNPSRTLALQRNLEGVGVYILHGDLDDNVPVEEARTMKKELSSWHKDLAYHEQPGAGHWWGNECVDWPPLIEFLQQRTKLAAPDRVQFITASPGVSASRDWVAIQQQMKAMEFSSVDLTCDVSKRAIAGTTSNVARLAIDVSAFGEAVGGADIEVRLDEQVVHVQASPRAAGVIELVRQGDHWKAADSTLAPSHKTPARSGPFKAAFNHQFMFVYGTKGSPEENAWSFAKARFDAEAFWYRGNGSVDVIADTDFNPRDSSMKDRSVILYGNADTNGAWRDLLGDSPVQITRDAITVGSREIKSDDAACVFVRPRPSSDIASVGVVGGTGIVGCRMTDRLPYFVSGVAYPDCAIFDAGDVAIIGAGFFGNDWGIDSGEFAWKSE